MDSSKGGGLSVQDPNVDITTLTPLSPEVISRQVRRGLYITFMAELNENLLLIV